MKSLKNLYQFISFPVSFLIVAILSLAACGGGGDGDSGTGSGGVLTLAKTLTLESGSLAGIAESGEVLTYRIVIGNTGKNRKTTRVTEMVPAGTSFSGDDDFSDDCSINDPAGTSCQSAELSIPGKGNVTITFKVTVDDRITTISIDNTVRATGVDCQENDCTEVTATTGITTGFLSVSQLDWTDTSVRKVLFAFAYGGLATEAQIATWSAMNPEDAIVEMLDFSFSNEKLSPGEDASDAYGTSLESLQDFWGGSLADNPMRQNKRQFYSTLMSTAGGSTIFSLSNLQRTWIQAVNTRGLNPFLHRVGMYLTNYQMALSANSARKGIFRSYYDDMLDCLVASRPFTACIAEASKAAATARRYGHQYNVFNNASMEFRGNDDFAREYFQLFFRYLGADEDIEYHENVNIENNAKLLTGMNIDLLTNAYGEIDSTQSYVAYVAPILFADHADETSRLLNNESNHHSDCLEILHQSICGATAAEKIDALSPILASNSEVMNNLPVYIIGHFADDRLSDSEKSILREGWIKANDDLLLFLRNYAVSKTFHSADRVKFNSVFNRNLTLYNTIVLDNEESFVGRDEADTPLAPMGRQGGQVFVPAHDVFGAQTGKNARDNAYVFKDAFNEAYLYSNRHLASYNLSYFVIGSGAAKVWDKDWANVIPANADNEYLVGEIAEVLWKRMIADGGKNFDVIARSQVMALLAYGYDFGYAVTVLDPSITTDPDESYSSPRLTEEVELVDVMDELSKVTMDLDSNDSDRRRTANMRMSAAINFISMMPYTFALEGK